MYSRRGHSKDIKDQHTLGRLMMRMPHALDPFHRVKY